LIINFNVPEFYRKAGWLASKGKPALAFIELLNRIMGSDEWQRIARKSIKREQFNAEILQLYRNRIKEEFHMTVASYPIREFKQERLKYCLVFAARHPLGLRIMNNIIYGVEIKFLEERAKYYYPLLADKFVEQTEMERMRELKEDIRELGRIYNCLTFGEIQDMCMWKWFGRIPEKHYRRVCQDLIDEEYINGKKKDIKDDTPLYFNNV
jgi:hypothetical protein